MHDCLAHDRLRVRFAGSGEDLRAAQRLRFRAFRARGSAEAAGIDGDEFDARALHVLVEEIAGGRLLCCFRLLHFTQGREVAGSYSAQFYDLASLARLAAPMIEMGRFCVAEGVRDPDVLRLAWAALAHRVAASGAAMLFGCSSFRGTDAAPHAEAFALLGAEHVAPRRWRPRVKAPGVLRLPPRPLRDRPDRPAALRAMPPLLRSYLAMGARVSDHAVVDRDLDTLHVFTGLEIRKVPGARARRLGPGSPAGTA